jgi:hypothetical protein
MESHNVKAQGREPLCGEASPWSVVLGRAINVTT